LAIDNGPMVKHGNLVSGASRCYYCGEVSDRLMGGIPLCRVCSGAREALDKKGSREVPLKEVSDDLARAHVPPLG